MDILAIFGLGMIGFLFGNLLFGRVAMWIATVYELGKARDAESKGAALASAIFLNDGRGSCS